MSSGTSSQWTASAPVPSRSGRLALLVVAIATLASAACISAGTGGNEEPICDGSASVRLAFRVAGGGPVLPGSEVLSENGFAFLLVEGTCRAWMFRDRESDTRTAQLSVADAEALARDLRVTEWAMLQGDYVRNLCDGPSVEFRFASARILVSSSCGGRDTAGPVSWLEGLARRELAELYAVGTSVDGAARFVLVAEAPDVSWPNLVIQAARPWPLSTAADVLAISSVAAQNYQAGSSRAATPVDAAALRVIRRRFYESGGGPLSGGFIPILDGGARYQLFVRDSIPLEDAQGLLHVD